MQVSFQFKDKTESREFIDSSVSGELITKIYNEGSSKDIQRLKKRATFRTFNSTDSKTENEFSIKSVGLGLSTADALTSHLGGKFSLRNICNDLNQPVATEVVFSVLTIAKN